MAAIILYLVTLYAAHISCEEINRPHIVIVVGDDIGWDDISLHGSDQILTPNIDMLGYQGVIINNYYTDCQGTPSASAMFTGKYPMKMATQGPSIGASEDRGVPISEQLLPSYLKDLGYKTHLVGKWQLGKSRESYLPMNRGFDTYYGFTGGSVDYFTYFQMEHCNGTDQYGFNLFHNLNPVRDAHGHLTDILTEQAVKVIENHDASEPLYLHLAHAAAHTGGGMVNLQASDEDVTANWYIAHSARRYYAALVTGLDKSIGKIVAALDRNGMLSNTLIVFTADNGAQSKGESRNFGSNLPLRGTKGTPWEGAVRSTAVMWHAAINPKLWTGLFHVTDWLPTLVAAAGGNINEELDGVNNWPSVLHDVNPNRTQIIIAVDDLQGWGAFRDGDFKLIVGNVSDACGYYGQELNKVMYGAPGYEETLLASQTSKVFTESLQMGLDIAYALEKRDECNLNNRKVKVNDTANHNKGFCVPNKMKGCLYNISADPEESQDLWDKFPEIVQHMSVRFRMYWSNLVRRSPPMCDPNANPGLRDYIASSWLNNDDALPKPVTDSLRYPLGLTDGEIDYYVKVNTKVLKEKMEATMDSMLNTLTRTFEYLFTL